MSNVLAGLGIAQFSAIETKIDKKRNIFDYYKGNLGGKKGVKFQNEKANYFSDRWLSVIYFRPDFSEMM